MAARAALLDSLESVSSSTELEVRVRRRHGHSGPHACHTPTAPHCCVHVHDVVVKKNTPLHSSKQGAKECLLCRPVCASCGSGPASLPPTAPLTPWILERDPPLSRMDRVLRAACVCVLPIALEGHRDAPPKHSPLSPNRTVATTTLARHN
jgi:hypothetical protein